MTTSWYSILSRFNTFDILIMAEAKIWPIFRWANWGLSDDLFTGIQNSFYYSQNLEIREDMRSIYPCNQAIIASWGSTVSWTPVKMLQLSSWSWAVFSSQRVYVLDPDTGNINAGTSLGAAVCDAEIFGDKIFVTTKTKLLSFDYSSPDWGNPTEVATLTSCNYHPLQATSTVLVIWDKNKIKIVLYNALGTAIDQITLASNCTVKLLDFLWAYTRIVIEKWYYRNEIWLWDNSKEAINERIPMDWYNFYQSVIYKWQHYLVSDKWLGLLNWYNYFIIKRFKKFSSNINSICVYDDKLYIGWTDWIYIYWAKNKNYSEVLGMWTYTGATVWALASNYEYIVSSKNGKVWADEVAASDWELQTMAYYGTSLSEIKQAVYLRIWYKIPQWWTLKVFYKTDAADWTELTVSWGITSSWDMRSPFATTLKLNCRFQWIQFKFQLSWGRNTHLYSADLYYNDMLD
jgi:hypothetical protein